MSAREGVPQLRVSAVVACPPGPEGPEGPQGPPGQVDVVQTTGTSETAVMSQKATTVAVAAKLDRNDSEAAYPQVYGKTAIGTQTLYWLRSDSATANSVPQRDGSGRVKVAAGVATSDAVNVSQLNTKRDVITGVSASDRAYVKLGDGTQGSRPIYVEAEPDSILMRDGDGRTRVVGGVEDDQAVNKSQLDTKLDASRVKQTLAPASASDVPSSAATATYVDDIVASLTGVSFTAEVVTELPATGESGVFYFVGDEGGPYDEYIWIATEERFELIGHTDIDLSGYLLKVNEYDTYKTEVEPTSDGLIVRLYTKDSEGEWQETANGTIGRSFYWHTPQNADSDDCEFTVDNYGLHLSVTGEYHDIEVDAGSNTAGLRYQWNESDPDGDSGVNFELTSDSNGLIYEHAEWDQDGDKAVRWQLIPDGLGGHWYGSDGHDHWLVFNAETGQLLIDDQPVQIAYTRQTASVTTSALTSGGRWFGSIPMAPGWRIYSVNRSVPCRLRVYPDGESAAIDADRPMTEDPPPNSGCLLDLALVDGLSQLRLSPLVDGYVWDGSDAAVVVDALADAPDGIDIELLWLRTE